MSSSYLTVSEGTISTYTVTCRGASGPMATPCHGCDAKKRSSAGQLASGAIRADYTAGGAGLPRRPRLGQNGSMRAARDVHVVAAEAGSERAAELLPALRAAGHAAHAHVLPPAAASDAGDAERLRQEVALVAGAVRAALADGGVLLLADERAALAVPEMMRVLLDEQGLGWDEAWARTRAATVLPLRQPQERAAPPLLARVVPRGRAAAAPGDPVRDQPPAPRRGRGALARRRRAPPPAVAVPRGRGAPAPAGAARGASAPRTPTWRRPGKGRPRRRSRTWPSCGARRCAPGRRRSSPGAGWPRETRFSPSCSP